MSGANPQAEGLLLLLDTHTWIWLTDGSRKLGEKSKEAIDLNGDGTPQAQQYVAGLTAKDFAAIESFFAREAHRYGVRVEQPVHIELYPQGSQLPPALAPGAGPLAVAWWSLKLRGFAAHASRVPGRAPPRIRLFVLYHDPLTLDRVPDSHGLQKGLVGVVHAFAVPGMAGSNNIVIAHELLHLRVPKHGKVFKALMTMYVPAWREMELQRTMGNWSSKLDRARVSNSDNRDSR